MDLGRLGSQILKHSEAQCIALLQELMCYFHRQNLLSSLHHYFLNQNLYVF